MGKSVNPLFLWPLKKKLLFPEKLQSTESTSYQFPSQDLRRATKRWQKDEVVMGLRMWSLNVFDLVIVKQS